MIRKNRTRACLGACLATLVPSLAAAQTSLLADKKATEGKTEVAASGFQTAAKPADAADETTIKVSSGMFLATGNAQSFAVTGAGNVRLRRGENQYSADAAVNYAEARVAPATTQQTTVENFQGRVRYDRFLSEHWAVFVQQSGRRDFFQGLDLRLNFDPGLAYYFLVEPKQHLTFEGGYDLQYDLRESTAIQAAADAGTPTTKTEVRHALRLYAGYDNSLNDFVKFDTGLEYLQAFQNTQNFRLNWISGLTSQLAQSFALSATFTLRYDNNPLPEVQKLDTITALSLVYTML